MQLLYRWGKSLHYLQEGEIVNTTFSLDAVRGEADPVLAMKAYRVQWKYSFTYS
jgi:hypothetical protein